MRTRTMIYLEPEQHRALRAEAAQEGVSMAELLRRLIAHHLEDRRGTRPVPRDAYLRIVGVGASGRGDVSARHDAYLPDAIRRDSAMPRARTRRRGSAR
jgi:hypothetical protein